MDRVPGRLSKSASGRPGVLADLQDLRAEFAGSGGKREKMKAGEEVAGGREQQHRQPRMYDTAEEEEGTGKEDFLPREAGMSPLRSVKESTGEEAFLHEEEVDIPVHVISKPCVLSLKTVCTNLPSGEPCRVMAQLYGVLVTGVPKLEKRRSFPIPRIPPGHVTSNPPALLPPMF